MSGGMAWPAVGVVGDGEASAAAQPATVNVHGEAAESSDGVMFIGSQPTR